MGAIEEDQVKMLLDILRKSPKETIFEEFCKMLEEDEQESIAEKLRDEAKEAEDKLAISENLTQSLGAMTVNEDDVTRHKRYLSLLTTKRTKFMELIDIDKTNLLDKLIESKVLTKSQKENIEELRGPSKRVAALIDHMHRRPLRDFDQLKEALRTTGHKHVADMFS